MDLGKVLLPHKSANRNAEKRNPKNLGTGLEGRTRERCDSLLLQKVCCKDDATLAMRLTAARHFARQTDAFSGFGEKRKEEGELLRQRHSRVRCACTQRCCSARSPSRPPMCPPSPSAQRDAVSAVPTCALRAWGGWFPAAYCVGRPRAARLHGATWGLTAVPRARPADAMQTGITLLKASEGHHFFSSAGMLCGISAGECMEVLRARSRAVRGMLPRGRTHRALGLPRLLD